MRVFLRASHLHSTWPFKLQPLFQIRRPIRFSIRHASSRKTHLLTITQPWLRLNCSLGEGPFWEADTNTLRFLDVEKQRVHRVDLNVGPSSHKVIKELDISIGYVYTIHTKHSIYIQNNPPQLHSRHRRQRLGIRLRRQIRLRHRQQANRRIPLDQKSMVPRRSLRRQTVQIPRQRRRRGFRRPLLGRLHVRPSNL
jgi:hypothetical protein